MKIDYKEIKENKLINNIDRFVRFFGFCLVFEVNEDCFATGYYFSFKSKFK